MQYMGIAVSAFTFVIDIYMTLTEDKQIEPADFDKKEEYKEVEDHNVEMHNLDAAIVHHNQESIRRRSNYRGNSTPYPSPAVSDMESNS